MAAPSSTSEIISLLGEQEQGGRTKERGRETDRQTNSVLLQAHIS